MNNTNLLIIDSRILNIEQIKASIKTPKVKYILLDYYTDTFITLNKKIENLGVSKIESIGLLRHGYILPTYKLLDKQKTPSILNNVETQDNLLNSWSEIRNFLLSLKFTYSLKNFDFLSCRLDKDSNYHFVFNRLETTLNINIRASNDDLGNISSGGNWILESDNVNIKDIYFNDKILKYPYLFFMTTVTVKAVSFTKPYDGVYFNEPLITLDLPVLNTLSGTISYSGTYTTGLNVGTYTIIPSGLSSTEYYINYENGTLTIIPTELSISVNDYIKVYDGTNTFNDYVINYSGLIDSETESVLSGTLTLSGSYLNAVNVGVYDIIPSGLSSNNYHITYDKTYLKIIPASLLVIANNVGKIYDRYAYTDFNTVFYDGFVNSESEFNSDLSGSLIFTGSFINATDVGTYIIQPSGLTSTNYDIMFINGILTIYYDDFLVAANNFRKFYDNLFFTNPTLSYFHTVWDVSGYLVYSGTYETAKNIGSYTMIANPTLNSGNYVISYYNGTLIIDKAEVKIRALPVTKIYDAIPYNDIPVTWEGLLGTDTSDIFIGQLLNVGTSYQSVNVGTYNIIPSGVDTQNYTIIYDESILTINKAPLVLNTQFYSKVYDGNNIGYGDVITTISGIINNESISVVSYDIRFHTNQAGYQFIDICNITLSGYTVDNYYIVPVPAVVGLIEPRLLTAWYTSKYKGYDGTREPNGLVGTLSGILGNDYVTISSSIAKFRQASIGWHFIDISSATLWGTDAGNYIVKTVTPIIGRIIQNNLIINWYGGHKIYDNNNDAKFTLTYSISGMIEEDNLTISGFTATYKSRDTGEWFIDISNVVYSSMFLDAYVFPVMKPVPGLIRPKTIYPYFVGGDKIYDSELAPGPISYTLSGIIGTQDVDISNWYPVYESPNAGYNLINFPQIMLTGFNSYNYILYNQISIIGLITAKTLVATFYGGNKIYDSYTTASLEWSLSGMIGQEIVNISSFDANFKSPTVGTWLIDVSNINLQNNNYVTVYEPFTRTISKKELIATFYDGDKTYDNNFDTGPITYSLSGMVNEEIITISSYYSKYKKKTVGYNLIDVSDIIISSDNYYVKAVPPFISYINYRYITPVISRGQKVYDKTNFTGPINIDLSNIALGEYLTISTYISRFKDVNSGIQLIDVSNLKIAGPTVSNYKLVPIRPFSSEIYPKKILLKVTGGDKTYDGTTVLGRVTRITLSGTYDGDSISLLNTWVGNFVSSNIGLNNVDISNIDLSGANVLNYVGSYVPFTRFILSKLLTITFSNVNKIYDGTKETQLLPYDISGIVENEFVDISSYVSRYRSKNAGYQIIDISNIELYGQTADNYIIRPIYSISSTIYQKDLIVTFEGGDKIYDGTLVPSLIMWSLSGQVGRERVNLSSFDSQFSNPNVGYNLIDFSNLVLSSNNYTSIVVPLYANIYYKNLDITFSGGSKIYDSTRYVGPTINGIISGIENNELITISTYIAFFSTQNVGRQRIDVSNVIIDGPTVTNYLINPIVPFYSNINKKNFNATFLNGDKNYDGTIETPVLDYSLSGIIGTETIVLTNWISKFKSSNVGYQFIDISNVSFNGFTASNYYLEPVKMLTAYISSIPIVASFNGGDKIYNSTLVTGPLTWTTSGMVNNEIITLGNYVSRYINPNAGFQRIDISNTRLFGATASNYYLQPVRPIMGTISQKDITVTFSGGSKVYDSTRYVGPLSWTTSGIIGAELITISTYISLFSTQNVGLNRIDVSNVIITGSTVTNYYLNPIVPHYSNINKKYFNATFSDGNKNYDGTRETPLLNYSLSGIIGTELIVLSSWDSKFKSSNVGYQFIDVSNISFNGFTVLNYYLEPVKMVTAYISSIPIVATFNGGNKIYDATSVPGSLTWTTSGMVNNERIIINNYDAKYINTNAGQQRIDISNIILFGSTVSNYYLQPVKPIMGTISKKDITATFSGGTKVYDSTRYVGPSINGLLSGIIGTEVITISTYIAFFSTQNVGLNRIDVSNLIIQGNTVLNYYLNPIVPHYSNINQKQLITSFYGGNKTYDGTTIPNTLTYSISGIIDSESIIISSWTSKYRTSNIGNQIIDISNVSLIGTTVFNYFIKPVLPIVGVISPRYITANFNGGSKTYDSLRLAGPVSWTINNIVSGESIDISSYNAIFSTQNVGLRRIDISNIILKGITSNNYIILPIDSIYALINKRQLNITFNNGDKIYDGTTIPNTLSWQISNNVANEVINVDSFSSFYLDKNVGIQRIDISNVILSGLTVSNYDLQPIQSIYKTISKRTLTFNFLGGNKIYNKTTVVGSYSWNFDNIVSSETISASFLPYYDNYNSGYQQITISNMIVLGLTNNNYNIQQLKSISGFINKRNLDIVPNYLVKNYDSTQSFSQNSSLKIVNGITEDNLSILYFVSRFKNIDVGYSLVDVSNIILGGSTTNYILNSVPSLSGYIIPKPFDVYFNNKDKVFDGLTTITDLSYSIIGIYPRDNIKLVNYNANFDNQDVGLRRLDISGLIFSGSIFNYVLNDVISKSGTITQKGLYFLFTGGDKSYDGTVAPGNSLNYTISGVINSAPVSVLYYDSKFNTPNVGLQRIDISNLSINNTNYFINPVRPINANIYKEAIHLYFTGGNKIYDGTTNVTNLDIIFDNPSVTLLYYNASFSSPNVGLNYITVTNYLLSTINLNNYNIITNTTISAWIFPKNVTVNFSGGNKKYDSTLNTGPLVSSINGLISGENIFVQSYNSYFRNKSVGFQQIDVSNIVLSGTGASATNYIVTAYSTNNGLISKADLSGILTADDKYYDGTTDVVNPLITLQNVYNYDDVVVSSFTSTFASSTYGLQKINTTNVVLSGLDANNYNIIVSPIYRNILSQSLNITFTGGSKIYDTTLNTGPLNITISGANPSDNINVIYYISKFENPNAGIQRINITNLILTGTNSSNYSYTIEPIYAEILPKPLDLIYFNKNKYYDGTQNLTDIYLQTNENITVSSFIGSYKSFNAINTFIDISNVILTNFNYTVKPIQSQPAIIYKRPITVIFYNGNKTYDGTTNFYGTNYYFQNVIASDTDISLLSYNGTFSNKNVGINYVTISNLILNNTNYEITFVPTISANIIPKVVNTNFKAYTRIYNNKTDVTLYNPIINGLINLDINTISISDWIANYDNKYVDNNKNINIQNIRFKGPNSLNYVLDNEIQTASGTIIPSPVTVVVKSASKIYDKTTSTGLLSWTISGVYTEDLSGVIFNYTDSTFLNSLTENNKQIILSGSTISGNLAYNYNLVSYIATGDITKKPINIKFTGQNKIYDNTISAIVYNPIIYDIGTDIVTVNDYKSNFINSGVGINKLININNIILSGTDSFNYSANDSSANASIIYPTKINLNIVNNTWTYKDISNTAIINWEPSWIQDYITNIIDITNNIIITSDGKILNANTYALVQNTNLPLNRIRNNIISSNNQLLTTTNNWSSYSTTSYSSNIVSFSNNFVISNNQIYKSGNLIYTDFSSNFIDIEAVDSSNIFVITNNKFILTSNNGGISFTKQQITNVNDNFVSINMVDIYNGYIVGDNGLILRTNDGRIWTKLNTLTNEKLNSIYNINTNDVIIGGNNGIILKSSNRGITWSILTSGTNENILNIYATSFFDIKIVCSNSLLLTFISSPEGNLKLYDNQTLLFDTNVSLNTSQVVYNFTNFPVKKYWLNALFTPNLINSYSTATTSTRIQNIRPIYYYDTYLTDILFSTSFISSRPFVDQSGGTFSLIGNNLISINNTGNIIFSDSIPVGRYSFITIYTLATVSSQQTHQLIVRPIISYPNSNIQITYGDGLVLASPNISPNNGIFTISDVIGNLARTNKATITSSGILNIVSTAELGNYGFGITYNVNNIINSARVNVSILSNFGYIPGIINLEYLSGGKSELPFYDPSGGIFSLQDISSNIVSQNKVTVNSKGQLTFTNNIDVGFYNFRVIYRGNSFIYSVNSSPFFKYILQQDFKEIQYISSIIDASANASVIPSGGSFSCSNLINLVELNTTTGKLIYNPGIDVSSYYFNIKYEYNKGYKFIVHNLVVKPYINYYINYLVLPYNVPGNSIIPEINPSNGAFSLLEVDNILVQLNKAYINQTGQIIFTNDIPVGIYNFNVSYMYNSLITLFSYQLRVIPTINYNINTLTITYDNSGNSILPSVQPNNGIYTISSIIQLSKININSTTGRLSFNKEIPVGNYNVNVKYTNNNLSNSTNYLLNVIPTVYYKNNSSIINYKTSSKSERPYINPNGGTFSSNNTIIDLSGFLIFSNNLVVGNYNLLVNYTYNNNTNSTPYYLTVRPNISLLQSVYETYYDTSNNININDINVDQSGGVISVYDISGSLVSSNYVTQNIIYTSTNIPVNMYRIGLLYQLNNTFNNTYYDLIIRPRFYYINSTIYTLYKNSVNSELPYVIPSNGNYSIEDLSNNTTIFSNGQINFNSNIYVGSYYYKVNYFINQIISSSFVNLIVLPVINYNINSLTILYDTSGISIAPYVNPSNGIFSGSNININSNGIISFDRAYNYSVGTNIITVNYSVNNITNSTTYTLNVLPIVYYTNNTSIVDYGTVNNSSEPYYQQNGGLFEIADYIGSLVETNQVLIDNSGIILFNNNTNIIDVGQYSFIIKYTLQNLSNTTIYNLTVKPVIYYSNNILAINYENFGNSDLPVAMQQGGLFGISDVSGSLVFNNIVTIDTSGIIYCTNQLDVGLYTLNVSYTLNNLTANTYFYVKILPVIRYPSLNKVLNYQTAGTSTIPIANPSKGFYSVNQVALINSGTGQLTFTNNIDVGKYIIPVFYTYNGITTSINFNLTVNPILIYSTGITTLLYNHEISYSEQPTYLQKGGVFEISNNLFNIDNSGIIMFDKFINVGKYYFDIKYTLADVFVKYTYLLNVIPNIDLNYNYIELDYTNVFSEYVIPYVDQSGGTFTFEDLSGSLISNLDVNYQYGIFNLSNTIDVNLYTMKIIYTYNNTSNFALFTLNIKPIYFYSTDNFTTIYNSNKYSIQPYVNQAGGNFSIETMYNGLFIDASNGIINFGYDLEIGDYSLILKYALRNTYSTTNYFIKVLPILDYGYPYFISEYNTTTYTPEAIYDPVGGTFTIQGASDISSNIIINNLIETNAISINSGNGLITFNSSIPVGLYLLKVNYNYGNTFNSTEISYTMKPYLLYTPSSNRVPYHDISFSVMPTFAPSNGIFTASVPRINLIYTGISIDKNNGIIRFGLVNAGFWTLTVKYTVNGVSNTVTYTLQILANVYYNPPYSVIGFNSVSSTAAPIAKVLGGVYTLQETTNGISINSTTGILTFSYLTTGIYYIPIVYTVFGSPVVINYTLLVKPTVSYNPDTVNAFYTNPTTSTIPSFNPPNGKFSATFNDINNSRLLSTIQIDASSGIITSTEDLRVGAYNLNVSYLSNSSEEIIPYTINIYPNLAYSQGSIITTYGSDYFTEKPFVNPKRGVFTSLDPQFYVDGSGGVIEIKNTNNVGKYIVPVQYKYNNMSVYSNYNIIINPWLDYVFTKKEMLYGYQNTSEIPIAKQSLGTFYINSISGTFNIPIQTSYSLNQNTFNNFGVVLNGYSGLLNFGSNIKVGKYKFNIKYAINDLSSNQIYDLTVYPNVYYTLSSLVLDYNTTGLTTRPFVDQSGGYFTIGNITDYRNEASKININNLTGLINFYKGISVGLYNFNIKYELNKIVNYAKYSLNVRPNYYYLNDTLDVIYGSIGYSNEPFVLTTGGKFYIENYGLLDEYTLSINETTGIININLVSINRYTIRLKYVLDGSVTFTDFTIIVKPYISYLKGSINIDYGLTDYSEIPFGLEKFGTYSFDNIDELDFQKTKVSIDSSNGQIYFGDYINVGSYNLSIKYTVNQIYNTFNYVLNVKPLLSYTVSGVIINYNIFTEKYTLDLPTVVPTKGLFYFNDSSNSFIQSNISLDKFTGEINLYNRIPPNDYNLFINYYLKNIFNQYYIKLQVYPNYRLYEPNNNITIYYDISNIITGIPYVDPSGGTFEIIQPMDINLYSKVNINTNGSLNIQSNIKVGSWILGLVYSKIKSTQINVNINVKPTVRYLNNYLNLLNGNTGETEIPYISPFGGIFELENANENITINSTLGIVSVGILDIGIYNFNIKYTYDNITTVIPFSVYVLFLFKYDISGSLINYNYSGFSNQPNIDIYNGIFSIPNSYKNIGINIDSSNGILSFSDSVLVNNYIIPVTYNVSNLFKTNNYFLTVQPYISYDISNIEINYLSKYKSNKPIVNPKSGSFQINNINNVTIDSSGQFIIGGLDIGSYDLNINYTYNQVSNKLTIPVLSKPIFYYTNNNVSTVYNKIFYSDAPTISPLFGTFSINNTNTNTNINQNTGIIQVDSQLDIGKYIYNIGYTINNITTYLNYYVKQLPYFTYNNEINNIIAGTSSQSNIPVALPYGGTYSIINNNNNNLLDTLYNNNILLDTLYNNNILLDTISGVVYFSDNFDIETVSVNINYSFNDISSSYKLVKNMIPSIYYPTEIFDYGISNTSISPIKNRDNGKFYINFEPQTYIQTEKISIDSSNGIIKLDNGLDVGKNFFYVGYYKNKLETIFTYNFIIRPMISYSNVNVIQTETTILTPELKPITGNDGNIYLLSQYDFISLVSSKTGQLSIRTAPVGFYNINMLYMYKDVSSNFNFDIIINPEFYYNSDANIVYGYTGDSDAPYISQTGGTFDVNINEMVEGLIFDTDTGIFSFGEGLEVGAYQITVYYIINSITVETIFNFNVLPYINYDNFYTVEYGIEGESFQPTVIPSGGTFILLNEIDGITVDETFGVIYTTNILKVNTYELNIGYNYNGVQGSGILILYVIPKTLFLQIEVFDKIYDGTSSVKVKSNKLSGVINNDKVFIKNTYSAYFISPNVSYFVPVYLSNLELDGPDVNNYIIEDAGNTLGNILYITYRPSYIRVNYGTSGNSSPPLLSESFSSPLFLIKNPVNGITIDPYGTINWTNTLNIGIYNLKILIYNVSNSFELDFTLEVTTNLYNSEFPIIAPNIENISFEQSKYNLRYNDTVGKAYVIETNEPALLTKIEINAYDQDNLLNHDLLEYKPFYFNLPNSDASDSLIISELNDDGTVNPKYIYDLVWVQGTLWQTQLRYLSDFYIQNTNILTNNPPTFNLPSGTYFSILQIIISALPTSKIYYTLNGTTPTIDSILYTGPITISTTKTIKAFVITPGYINSSVSSVTYEINYIPCILSNTLVKTPDGYEFIDNLKIGDLVVNSLGQEVPIKNILKYYIEKPKEKELPIIVPKDFFGLNIPNKDTYITENHAILIKNNKWLLGYNNLNLFKKLDVKPLYYNIELPNYFNDHLVVNNMPIESWCARKYKYRYINRTQENINNKKVIVVNKNKI